jgi:hypothetical protein
VVYGETRQGEPFVSVKIIEIYLLRVLFEADNSQLQSDEAMDRIHALIGHLFTEADYATVEGNVERWRNNVLFARLALANDGLIIPYRQAGLGHWELTDAGIEEAYNVWADSTETKKAA